MRRSYRLSTKKSATIAADSSDEEVEEPKRRKLKSSSKRAQKLPREAPSSSNHPRKSSDSSSESDIENYLQHPDKIDLNLPFFDIPKSESQSFDSVEKSIFGGVDWLSASESEEEQQPVSTLKNQSTTFAFLHEYEKKFEEARKSIADYEASKKAKEVPAEDDKPSQNVLQLLAKFEPKNSELVDENFSASSTDYESYSESEKEDWEEVKEAQTREPPKKDLEITVGLPTVMRKKKGKDLVASMKRRLNNIRKINQVLVHKVHLLCWLGHGNYVNEILNRNILQGLILSLLPFEASKMNLQKLQNIVGWYKEAFPLDIKNFQNFDLEDNLKLQIVRRVGLSKKLLVYLFVCLMRSLRLHCRLVISFQVSPVKPPQSELHSLSKKDKEYKNKKTVKSQSKVEEEVVSENETKTKKAKKNSATKAANRSKKNQKIVKTSLEAEENKIEQKSEVKLSQKPSATEVAKKTTQLPKQKPAKKGPANAKRAPSKKSQTVERKVKKRKNQNGEDEPEELKETKQKKIKIKMKEPKKNKSKEARKNVSKETKSKIKIFDESENVEQKNTKRFAKSVSASSRLAEDAKKSKRRFSLRLRNNNEILQCDGANDTDSDESEQAPKLRRQTKPKYVESDSDDVFEPEQPSKKVKTKRKAPKVEDVVSDEESDYEPEIQPKKRDDSDDEFQKSPVKTRQKRVPKKVQYSPPEKTKKGLDVWVEVYLDVLQKWISVDVTKGQVNCISELHARASHPITYIVAWHNDSTVKDITARYCPKFNTETRKLRIDRKWWDSTVVPFAGQKTEWDKKEDEELAKMQLAKPLPATILEYKNHPLYVLKRHILQVEALYPPDPATLGFIKGEPVYSRDCVFKLKTREIWFKEAKVVKPGETAYKIILRPKWDKYKKEILRNQPVDLFGEWQVEDYDPPQAKDGIVPRNEYGNVDLFQKRMLPKGTVHLQIPCLNKVARKMDIDCAPAMVGFDTHHGWIHPVFDGFVVCEEFVEVLIAAWHMEQEQEEKREEEKLEKRVYGNWKRLIKGMLIKERLNARYNFENTTKKAESSGTKKRKPKGSSFVSKKKRIQESDSSSDDC